MARTTSYSKQDIELINTQWEHITSNLVPRSELTASELETIKMNWIRNRSTPLVVGYEKVAGGYFFKVLGVHKQAAPVDSVVQAKLDADNWIHSYHHQLKETMYAWVHAIQEGRDKKEILSKGEAYKDLKSSKNKWYTRAAQHVFWAQYWKQQRSSNLQSSTE